MKKNYIFISYSHKDTNKVLPVVKQLAQNYRVKYDNSIGASSEYNDVIADMIAKSHIMFAFVSGNYTDSSYCMDELMYARSKNIPVLLIYLENTPLPAGVEMRVGRFQAIDFNDAYYMSKIQDIDEVRECVLGQNESSAAFMNTASTSKRRKPKKKLSSLASACIIMLVTVIATLLLGYSVIKIAGIDPSKLFDRPYADNQSGYQGESEDDFVSDDVQEGTGNIQLADKEEGEREPQIDEQEESETQSQTGEQEQTKENVQLSESEEAEEPQMTEPEKTTQNVKKKMETSEVLVKEMYSGAVCADGKMVWVERDKNDYS